MALMCPVDHPPGVGTTYCRLCGRTYVEVEDAPAPAALAPLGAGPVARVETPTPFPSLPVQPPPPGPPTAAAQAAVVAPAAPPAAPVQVVPVPASLGMQVHLPLVEVQPSPTSVTPLDLGGPTITAPEQEDAPGPVRRQLDRTAVLAGVLGFVGGAVSGAAVTLLLG